MKRALSILLITLLVCLSIGLPSAPVLKISVSKSGKSRINLDLKNIADPFCLVSLEFAREKSFKNIVESFVIGPANFSKASIEFKFPGTPVDSNNELIENIYSRLAVDCSDSETAGSSKSQIYSIVQTLDLSKLSDRNTVPEDKFFSSLAGKTLTSAVRKSRSKFSNSLKTFGQTNQLPVITSELSDKTFAKDQDIIFRIGAEGSKPVRYDWLFSALADGPYSKLTQRQSGLEIISDPRGSTLIIRSQLIDLAGFYSGFIKVKAYNRYGIAESAAAQILLAENTNAADGPTIPVPAATSTKTAAPTYTALATNTAVPTNTAQALCTPVKCLNGNLVCENNNCAGGCGYICISAVSPTHTPTKLATATKTVTPSNTNVPVSTATSIATATTAATATLNIARTPTIAVTNTAIPTSTATKIPTTIPTATSTKAPDIISGKCGTASGQSFFSTPVSNLCISGTSSSVVRSGDVYSWSCTGVNGGTSEICSAKYQSGSTRELNPKCLTRPLLEDGRPWCDNTGPSHRSNITNEFTSPVLVEVSVGTSKELRIKEGSAGTPKTSPAISYDSARGIRVFENFRAKGSLKIEARNVLVRNFVVENGGVGTLDISPSDTVQDIYIEDGEVFGSPAAQIGGSNYKAKRLHIHHGAQDFSNANSNISIEDSFFHNGGYAVGAHTDAIQYGANRIGKNVSYRRNYFYMPFRSTSDNNPNPPGTDWPSKAELLDPDSRWYAPHTVQQTAAGEFSLSNSKAQAFLFLENASNIENFIFDSNWLHGTAKGLNLSVDYNGKVQATNNKFECLEDWENSSGLGLIDFIGSTGNGNVHLNPYLNKTIAISPTARFNGVSQSTIYCSKWPS